MKKSSDKANRCLTLEFNAPGGGAVFDDATINDCNRFINKTGPERLCGSEAVPALGYAINETRALSATIHRRDAAPFVIQSQIR